MRLNDIEKISLHDVHNIYCLWTLDTEEKHHKYNLIDFLIGMLLYA